MIASIFFMARSSRKVRFRKSKGLLATTPRGRDRQKAGGSSSSFHAVDSFASGAQ
jgi:hypothetical protein